jgi:hypothetical protein
MLSVSGYKRSDLYAVYNFFTTASSTLVANKDSRLDRAIEALRLQARPFCRSLMTIGE